MKLILEPIELFVFYNRFDTTTYLVTCKNNVEVYYNSNTVQQWVLEYINDHEPHYVNSIGQKTVAYHYIIESEVN